MVPGTVHRCVPNAAGGQPVAVYRANRHMRSGLRRSGARDHGAVLHGRGRRGDMGSRIHGAKRTMLRWLEPDRVCHLRAPQCGGSEVDGAAVDGLAVDEGIAIRHGHGIHVMRVDEVNVADIRVENVHIADKRVVHVDHGDETLPAREPGEERFAKSEWEPADAATPAKTGVEAPAAAEEAHKGRPVDRRTKERARAPAQTTSDYDREKLQERLAKLAGGVAVIKVGAATEVELKEKKHRIEDALSATRAAIEEGIVAGGGSVLVHSIKALDKVKAEGDEKTGVNILRRALEEPFRQLVVNAGEDGAVVLAQVRRKQEEAKSPNWGYEVMSGNIVDLPKAGII